MVSVLEMIEHPIEVVSMFQNGIEVLSVFQNGIPLMVPLGPPSPLIRLAAKFQHPRSQTVVIKMLGISLVSELDKLLGGR